MTISFKLFIVRLILNVIGSEKGFAPNGISAWKYVNEIIQEHRKKTQKGQKLSYVLLSWFGVELILEYDATNWFISLESDNRIFIQAKLTNGCWGYNRKTIENLKLAFDNVLPSSTIENALQDFKLVLEKDPNDCFSAVEMIFKSRKQLDLLHASCVDKKFFYIQTQGTIAKVLGGFEANKLVIGTAGYLMDGQLKILFNSLFEESVEEVPYVSWKTTEDLHKKIMTAIQFQMQDMMLLSKL